MLDRCSSSFTSHSQTLSADAAENSAARRLLEAVRALEAPAALYDIIDDVGDSARARLVLHTILFAGSKTFSHLVSFIEK